MVWVLLQLHDLVPQQHERRGPMSPRCFYRPPSPSSSPSTLLPRPCGRSQESSPNPSPGLLRPCGSRQEGSCRWEEEEIRGSVQMGTEARRWHRWPPQLTSTEKKAVERRKMDLGETYQVVLHRVPLRDQTAFYDQHQKELPLPERKERLRFDLASQNLYWEVVSRCSPVGAVPLVTFSTWSVNSVRTTWWLPPSCSPVALVWLSSSGQWTWWLSPCTTSQDKLPNEGVHWTQATLGRFRSQCTSAWMWQ